MNYNLLQYENFLNKQKVENLNNKLLNIFDILHSNFKYNNKILTELEKIKEEKLPDIYTHYKNNGEIINDILFKYNYNNLINNFKLCNICNKTYMNNLSYDTHLQYCKNKV